MTRKWFHIAKAEFLVLTAGMRKHRGLTVAAMYMLGVLWAVYLAPLVMGGFVTTLVSAAELRPLLVLLFPGLMRSLVMFIWLMVFLLPLSKALEEIRIGHWEILLSHKVKTREILVGTFLGSVPLYGLITLILLPLVISPFVLIMEISVMGTVLIYSVLIITTVTTLWLSSFTTAAIQSRLGDSSRGNDIAKALAMVVAIIAILPMYLIMYAAPLVSEVLGMDVFLLMPFTWSADLVSWTAVAFNGIGLTTNEIALMTHVLQLDLLTSLLLMGAFTALIFGVTTSAADRVFTIAAGARTERITTVGRENIMLRGIRRAAPGSFGSLVAVNIKDYFRKAQNLSKIFYGVILATILPVMMVLFMDEGPEAMDVVGLSISTGMAFAVLGAFPFTGVGFLESKAQLWIIQGAPRGPSRYVRARVIMAVVSDAVLTLIPVAVIGLLSTMSVVQLLLLWAFGCAVAIGSSMVGIGTTAKNPDYEDTKSPAHQANVMTAMMIPMITMMGSVMLLVTLLGMNLVGPLIAVLGTVGFDLMFLAFGPLILLAVGTLLVKLGIGSLSRAD